MVLLSDINVVLSKKGVSPIELIGKTKTEQNIQTEKFVKIIDKFKDRIFNTKSSTFLNLMSILNQTNKWGDERENLVVKKLKPIFGDKNVKKVGMLGGREDMIGGIDCEIIIDGVINTPMWKENQGKDKSRKNWVTSRMNWVAWRTLSV